MKTKQVIALFDGMDAKTVKKELEPILIYFALKYNNDDKKIKHALVTCEKPNDIFITRLAVLRILHDKKYSPITMADLVNYPDKYKQIDNPPFVIWGGITKAQQAEFWKELNALINAPMNIFKGWKPKIK